MVRTLLPAVTQLVAQILKETKVGKMAYGGTDSFNAHWRDLSARFNSLTRKANPGANLLVQKIGWPQPLLSIRRGRSVGASNPPQFESIIDNESGLKDWVRLNLSAQPLQVLIVPTSQLKA